MPEAPTGLRKGRGTKDYITHIQWILKHAKDHQKAVRFYSIDYNKAFESIGQEKIWNVLKDMGVPQHLIVLMRNLYSGKEATIGIEYEEAGWFPIGKDVRQGYTLSPYLFNIYAEHIVREAEMDEDERGIKIDGRKINDLRYANGTTLLANKPKDMKGLVKKLKEESIRAGLQLNLKKIKVMTTGTINNFTVGNEEIEIVQNFTFLKSISNQKGDCTQEIRRRMILRRTAMKELETIIKDKNVTLETKIKIVRTMVFPIIMYESESWTAKKTDRKRTYSLNCGVGGEF